MNDLFGNPIVDRLPVAPGVPKKRRDPAPNGYSAPPGTGPKDQTCKTCRHFVRKVMSKTYFKCWLMNRTWTGGGATDIRANSPACRNWASKPQVDPDATSHQHLRVWHCKH
jgi:hypothetical protein